MDQSTKAIYKLCALIALLGLASPPDNKRPSFNPPSSASVRPMNSLLASKHLPRSPRVDQTSHAAACHVFAVWDSGEVDQDVETIQAAWRLSQAGSVDIIGDDYLERTCQALEPRRPVRGRPQRWNRVYGARLWLPQGIGLGMFLGSVVMEDRLRLESTFHRTPIRIARCGLLSVLGNRSRINGGLRLPFFRSSALQLHLPECILLERSVGPRAGSRWSNRTKLGVGWGESYLALYQNRAWPPRSLNLEDCSICSTNRQGLSSSSSSDLAFVGGRFQEAWPPSWQHVLQPFRR